MASVELHGVSKRYARDGVPAVAELDLGIEDGELFVLLGPSGCGKSTLLKLIGGLEEPSGGEIRIDGRLVNHVSPGRRDVAMVFQNYALYPHMTVEENMAFALKMAKMPEKERKERVAEAARILGLEEYLQRKPKALSGGQRQRVAMGRAIVRKPQVFCMDEPLSNLDAKMRVQTRTDIAKLQQDLGVTTVYVTHDQIEAMTMGDRVAVMDKGDPQQVDTPLSLYNRPANLFVAGFIGSPQMNLLQGTAVDGAASIGDYKVPVDPEASKKMNGRVTVGVRPENWRLVGEGEGLPIKITVVEELGADSYVYGSSDVEGVPSTVIVRVSGQSHPHKGEVIHVTTDPEHVHVFDTESGERLSA